MSNNSFARAMQQIAGEAEAQRQNEIREEQRRKTIAKVRQVCVFLFGAAILGCGFYYRAELQKYAADKFGKTATVNGETSEALKGLQENAAKRDAALEQITKK